MTFDLQKVQNMLPVNLRDSLEAAVFKTEIQLRETKFLAAARQRTSHAEEANFFSEACSVNYIVMKSCTIPVEHCQGMIPFDLLWDILNVN